MTTSAQRAVADVTPAPQPRRRAGLAVIAEPGLWLALYLAGLAFVGFWPVPVDRDAGDLLDALTVAVPWLTYERIETAANVLLFVPFGFLLAATLRGRVIVSFALAVLVSIAIEVGQAVYLVERTPTVVDVLANSAGAAVGIAAAVAMRRFTRR
jgi:hypothetical protein